jgi:ABC-type anion transport system duplicated permease subunit
MSKNFPADEFDSVKAAGGRHRAKPTAGSRLLSFSRYALVTVVISAAGIFGLDIVSGTNNFSDVIGGGSSTVGQSEFNANGLGVTVIDATDKSGLASKVAHKLYSAGWNVLTATNSVLLAKLTDAPKPAVPAPAPSASATANPADKTVVYVTTSAAQSAANDLLKTLGTYDVVQSNQYADPITVVLGNDYK